MGVLHSLILNSKCDSKPPREFPYFCLPRIGPVCSNVMGHILKQKTAMSKEIDPWVFMRSKSCIDKRFIQSMNKPIDFNIIA